MLTLGEMAAFPLRLGGGTTYFEQELGILLDRYEEELGLEPDYENKAEAAGEAIALSMMWACSERLSNQAIPERMLENLAVWEAACGMRPVPDDTDRERRTRLAAKMRGQVNNATVDIEDVASKALGSNFVELKITDPTQIVRYWPGINPGPPGYEWSSNHAHVVVVMTKDGLSQDGFERMRGDMERQLQTFLPAWMTFDVTVQGPFTAGGGKVGETGL